MTDLADRLKEARTTAGMSQTELADRSGVSQSTIANIESGRNEGSKHIVKIAEALNHNVHWLVYGKLPRMVHNVRAVLPGEERQDPNVQSDAPIGTLPSPLPDVWMDRSEVRSHLRERAPEWRKVEARALCVKTSIFPALATNPGRCRVISVPDDSMEPFVWRDDLFMVDLTKAYPRDGRIYAVLLEGELLIRQVFKEVGAVTLHAYNPKFPDKKVSFEQADALEYVGEYVYRAGRAQL